MSSNTRAACVIGWPAKQSRSPKLHGYWIKRYKIDGDYRVEEIAPEAFPAFIKDLAGNGYVGANITMPHKDAALALSEPDDRARTDRSGEYTLARQWEATLHQYGRRGLYRFARRRSARLG